MAFRNAILSMVVPLLVASTASAVVDMRNANYASTWTDIEIPGTGFDLKILRTYNSRSLFSGIFGFGWCSDYETSLEITAESNLKLRECGGGLEIVYSPREINRKDVQDTIAKIIGKIKAQKKVGLNEEFYKKLSQELLEDDDKRASYARQHNVPVSIKEGAKFFANGREVEHIIFAKGYYTRNLADGSSQRFNEKGYLTHLYDKNNNYVKIEYDKNNLIKEVSDNAARKLTFKFNAYKKVEKIVGPNGLSASYTYHANHDDLKEITNAWKNTFGYTYDDLHNLTKATWPDKTDIKITYDKNNDWVTSFSDRDNCVENYKYEFSKNDPKNHYWSTVKKLCKKKVTHSARYEFWHKQRADGEYYLQRVLSDINNDITDITYHQTFGRPITIRRNSEKTIFAYYDNGLVKTKKTKTAIFAYEYHPAHKKVSKVTVSLLDAKGKVGARKISIFSYDKKGNLSAAENSDGQKVALSYDPRGRIETIKDQAKKTVSIKYDSKTGKPAVVSRPGLGTIMVSYKANGEIGKVDSKDGPTVAMQVANTFNHMLDIIAPATAEIYL